MHKHRVLILCMDPNKQVFYMQMAHVTIGNVHFSLTITLYRIAKMGVYWPTIYKDVHEFIRGCSCQMKVLPIELNHVTLYKTQLVAPKWAKGLVEYLTTNVMLKKMSKVRQQRCL